VLANASALQENVYSGEIDVRATAHRYVATKRLIMGGFLVAEREEWVGFFHNFMVRMLP